MSAPVQASSPQPPSLDVRLIQGVVNALRRHPRWVLVMGLVGVLLGLLWQGLYTVPTNQSAALFRFGALLRDDVPAGIHFKLPEPINSLQMVNTSELRHVNLSGEGQQAVSLVSADAYLIDVDVALQYRITDLGRYLVAGEDWELVLRLLLVSELSRQVSQMDVDEVLTTGKSRIQLALREQAQKKLDAYGSGLTLISTNLIFVRPPPEAAGSFNRVADAKAEQGRLLSEAQAGRAKQLSATRGQVAALLRQAESSAKERVQQARGEAQRYQSLRQAYHQAKKVGRTDLFTQKMKKLLGPARLIVLDPKAQGDIDINVFANTSPTTATPAKN